ncbi:hypothetical protein LEP3755_64830 (plasmid) [Leptolyngbya sp. NIES-3755]|nr:hypothetical protein LEP3755_64830 [Leptolyngbya sp. NIES-3755]
MPRKTCGFGFSCAAMMMQPGLEPQDCPNIKTCGLVTTLTPEEEVELIRVREIQWQQAQEERRRVEERIWVTRHRAAIMMLMARGCSQTLESLGITEPIAEIATHLETLRSHLQHFQGKYIAPEACEIHRYSVKRPYGKYGYNKLTAETAIFEPSEKETKVRVIHLSHDDDPRNLEGQRGIDRRNSLTQIRTQLKLAEAALAQAVALASVAVEGEEVLAMNLEEQLELFPILEGD